MTDFIINGALKDRFMVLLGTIMLALAGDEIRQVTEAATAMRVRPVAITSLANIVGLITIIWASGTGADVTQRIAAPAMGGMLTVLILSLLVFPVVYSLVLQIQESRKARV